MKKFVCIAVLFMLTVLIFSQEKIDSEIKKISDRIANESEYYGLFIGINDYTAENLPDLNFPVPDAKHL